MGLFGRIIVGLMPLTPKFVINRVARRYVAGSDLESAIALMQKMEGEGACFTIDVLGCVRSTLRRCVLHFPARL